MHDASVVYELHSAAAPPQTGSAVDPPEPPPVPVGSAPAAPLAPAAPASPAAPPAELEVPPELVPPAACVPPELIDPPLPPLLELPPESVPEPPLDVVVVAVSSFDAESSPPQALANVPNTIKASETEPSSTRLFMVLSLRG
ncbi:MAG TPA: hypothetical protein VFU02_21045 [Polyangiaceae bacterium]|nr:hypothetical protein [Polyangiaceae bacterium]